ncbi:hypothetical protein ACJZ2D_010509 [Fusarium nematophilum]
MSNKHFTTSQDAQFNSLIIFQSSPHNLPQLIASQMSPVHLKFEDEGAPDFADRVVDILNAALALDGPTSPSAASRALDSLFDQEYATAVTADGFLWCSGQDQLAAVIKALHDRSPKAVRLSREWSSDGNTAEVWKRLPLFAVTFRERLTDWDPRATGEIQRKERLVNLQAFAARVQVYAIWALGDAPEGAMTPIRGAPDEVNQNPSAVEDMPYKVKSAAAWMIHAGPMLYGRDEQVHGATAGPLWRLEKKERIKLRRKCRGTDGLCPQRWQLWKERFVAVRDADGLEEEVRRQAGDAYIAMSTVEIGQRP